MTIRIQADTTTDGQVAHRWYPESGFGTLSFGRSGHLNSLYFDDTDSVDTVIAELVALRAEMTGDQPETVPWPASLPEWAEEEDGDGRRWRTVLGDGRTALVERLDDGRSFLPTVHESSTDYEVGPVCATVQDAAYWCAARDGQHDEDPRPGRPASGSTSLTAIEFTTTSLPGRTTARCLRPGRHGRQLEGAAVDCDVTGHHAPASVPARHDEDPRPARYPCCEHCAEDDHPAGQAGHPSACIDPDCPAALASVPAETAARAS